MIAFPNLGLEFEVGRTAFRFFGLDIYWYGVIISAAIVLGFLYAMKRSRQFGMIADKVFDCAAVGLLGGFLGARLYYVIFSETKYTIVTFFSNIRDGGLAIYGGIIGAVIFGLIAMKFKKMKMLPILDLAGMSFLLGIGLGRWGNFFNQEAYGGLTTLPWGMTGSRISQDPAVLEASINAFLSGAENPDALVHPCFLYESLWCLLGFALLHFYSKKLRTFDGEIFLLFAAWYGFGRVFIEQLRSDSLMLGGFKISQLLAAASFGAAIGSFIYFKQKTRKEPKLYSSSDESAAEISAYELKLKLGKEKTEAKKALNKAEEIAPSILGGNHSSTEENEQKEGKV
ncbi:MAG: prolipoprotein diacylglyceryl transferase [Oscillospiraceae bacterium]|nr:prolipoprotein diacylglyceryl transferase [Oscillospiraceae bacterium]